MQENLLFFGIAEASLEENDYTETNLRDFLATELKAPNDRIQRIVFDRVHRIGRPHTDPSTRRVKPRPVVAKFENYTDRESIRKTGIEVNKQRTGFSIREHFPPEIEERHKTLYPVMRSFAKDERNRNVFVRDKLYINGKYMKRPRLHSIQIVLLISKRQKTVPNMTVGMSVQSRIEIFPSRKL